MVNTVHWKDVKTAKIGVAEPTQNEFNLDKKGKQKAVWFYIGYHYTYDNGEQDILRIRMDPIEHSGITENEYEDAKTGETTQKRQIGTWGVLSEEYIKFMDKLRIRLIELAKTVEKEVSHLEDFNYDHKKTGIKPFYWTDKKNPKRRRQFLKLGPQSTFFLPSSKTKAKTAVLAKKDITENSEKGIYFKLIGSPIWEVVYFYAGSAQKSIIYRLYQDLVTKVEVSGTSSAQEEEAAAYLEKDDGLEDANEENLRAARALASAEADPDEPEELVEQGSESDDEGKKSRSKGKGKPAKISKDFNKLMGDDDSDEESKPKKGKGKAKKVESDEEEEEPQTKRKPKAIKAKVEPEEEEEE
jgi:hypothetical protein